MMKYLTILCLSLGLTGCFGWGPYASVNGPEYGPVPDLAACARSPEPTTRIDQLCNRQDGNPYGFKLIAAHYRSCRVMISDPPHAFLFRCGAPTSFTPSADAFCRVAV
jgi:hypothetical protein